MTGRNVAPTTPVETVSGPHGDVLDDPDQAGGGGGGVAELSPTDLWLAAVADVMPPLEGPEGVAERLLLLLHYGIDWRAGWVGRRRATYWERLLPDRVITATYRTQTLRGWWREVADELDSAPRTAAQRVELERLLRATSAPVLEVLRSECEALVLRTRITADTYRQTRTTADPRDTRTARDTAADAAAPAPGGEGS